MRSTTLTISLATIEQNYRKIRASVGDDVKVMAVVKADAYGHGLIPVAKRLEAAGAEAFAVAILEEALELREAGVSRPILAMGGIISGGSGEAVRGGVSVAVYDAGTLEALEEAARREGRPALAHLKIDTGMARLGVRGDGQLDELLGLWKNCPHVRMEGAFSHFAVADTDPEFTRAQDRAFRHAIERVRAAGFSPITHDASTSGICDCSCRHDMVRPGIGLYGSLMPEVEGLRMAQRLTARPVRVMEIEPGETVSYGRTFTTRRETRIMTVPIGYGDGYPRILGNRADVLVRGMRAPIVGRVCMDMLMADVTDIPGASMGDEIVLLGRQGDEIITADELARHAETIPYEIMLGFTPRVRRVWED
ncbi:MAG: alanine racemase [Clostridiales bacterium]|nr:alanine racemase [Clostridiales bacterium]OPZ68224.1 MAG: Alanine racemase [Firmicutes bacterium ADurb.Bin467]